MEKTTNTNTAKLNVRLLFRVFEDKPEGRIVRLLNKGKRQNLTVTEIHQRLDMEQSEASAALSKLRQIGLVNCLAEGKFRYYSLDKDVHSNANQIWKYINQDLKTLLSSPIPSHQEPALI